MSKLTELADAFLVTYEESALKTASRALVSPAGFAASKIAGKDFMHKNRSWLEPTAGTVGSVGGSTIGSLAGGLPGNIAGGIAGEKAATHALGYENEQPPPGHEEWRAQFEHALKTDPQLAAALTHCQPVQNANDAHEAIHRGASAAGAGVGAAAGWYAGRKLGEKILPTKLGKAAGRLAGGVVGGAVGGFAGRKIGKDVAERTGYQHGPLD
jgi:uncharacterized protein YcfJ